MLMIWSVLACDGGSYRLCQVPMLGWDQHRTTSCYKDVQAQKLEPWWRGTGSQRDQLPLLRAGISNMNQEKNGFCANKYNKALQKHLQREETGKVMKK